ncbi:MAG: hypothetical protein GY856_36900 [bacterium]|nr:hypothetical protein [bacterium]
MVDRSGHAFPNPQRPCTEPGLTKREYFAAMAMQGELAAQSEEDGMWDQNSPEHLAERCVAFADALLEELAKPKEEK